MFDKKIYAKRRDQLKNSLGSGLVLLMGNEESPMNYADNTYRFRQDSTFLYYFGLDIPGLAGVIDIDAGDDILFGDDCTVEDVVWCGAKPSLKELGQAVSVDKVLPSNQLDLLVDRAEKEDRRVHFPPPYRAENKIRLSRILGATLSKSDTSASVELIRAVVAQRSVKEPEESMEIEKAVDVSVDMHVAAMSIARPGMKEYEIVAEITKVALASGGDISFPVILTINGQTLHNHYHSNTLKDGDMVLCDCGAETALHYAGDLSSTFPVYPAFTARQREIYSVVSIAHEAAISALGPAVDFRDVHLTACRAIAGGLKDLGLMNGDVDEAVSVGAHALFFPCGTGHMMGLDVHDMENLGELYVGYSGRPRSSQFGLKSLRLARALEPGFVVTIEPGVYFIPELIDQWSAEKRFANFINYEEVARFGDLGGIRNEEDFLITAEGYRRLGKPKPKTVEEVESLRRGK